MAEKSFSCTHRVTYADCTVGNHIYYSRYLDLLESARGELFRELGRTFLQLQEQDSIFPVLEVCLRYKMPARYDDVLAIELWPTSIERVRLNFAHRILNQHGKLVLEGDTNHVCTSLGGKPKQLPAELVAMLQPYLRAETSPAAS